MNKVCGWLIAGMCFYLAHTTPDQSGAYACAALIALATNRLDEMLERMKGK